MQLTNCYCGRVCGLRTSWTDQNLSRRYLCCRNDKVNLVFSNRLKLQNDIFFVLFLKCFNCIQFVKGGSKKCNFFQWLDPSSKILAMLELIVKIATVWASQTLAYNIVDHPKLQLIVSLISHLQWQQPASDRHRRSTILTSLSYLQSISKTLIGVMVHQSPVSYWIVLIMVHLLNKNMTEDT